MPDTNGDPTDYEALHKKRKEERAKVLEEDNSRAEPDSDDDYETTSGWRGMEETRRLTSELVKQRDEAVKTLLYRSLESSDAAVATLGTTVAVLGAMIERVGFGMDGGNDVGA